MVSEGGHSFLRCRARREGFALGVKKRQEMNVRKKNKVLKRKRPK